jgi:hypothetical protein
MNIKRYVSGAFGMIPADDGEWVMWSEIDEELRCAKTHIALLEEEAMELKRRLHDMALELVASESRLLAMMKGEAK